MADRFILSHLKRLPLFTALSPEQIDLLASMIQVLRYEPNEVVFAQGQPATGLVIVVSGGGDLTQVGSDGVERPVGSVQSSEYLNEGALFADVISPVSFRARETTILLYLSRQQFTTLITYRPDIRAALQQPPQPTSAMPVVPSEPNVFPGQRKDENVVLQTRRHWWAFVRRIWMLGLLMLVLVLLIGSLQDSTLLVLMLPLFLLGALASAYIYLEWRNDLFVVTDQRVVNFRREIFSFSTNISDIPLEGIQEINVTVPPSDPMARLFHYGTLVLKTSGDITNLAIQFLPTPKMVQDTVFGQQKHVRDRVAQQARNLTRNAIRGDIDRFLGHSSNLGTDGTIHVPSAPTPPPGFLSTRFINDNGEIVYRKHIFIWLQHIFLPALVALIGVVLMGLSLLGTNNSARLGGIGFVGAFVIVLVGVIWLYLSDWDWRNDLYIIGDQNIIIIHKRPLWLQNRKDEILISQIANVISDTSGFINSILNIGNVKLLLVGADANDAKWFYNVRDPQKIQQEISQRQERTKLRKQEDEAKREREQIIEYLSVYHETLTGSAPGTPPPASGSAPGTSIIPDQPPRVRDRSRPPGIPLVRRDNPPSP